MSAQTTTSPSTSSKARRWASSVNPAAASPRSGARSCSSIRKTEGQILYYKDGKEIDLKSLSYPDMRVLRKDLQLIFQDPYSSLNPRMTVGQIIGEGLTSHGVFKRGDPAMRDYIFQVMEECGLASYMFNRYPHQSPAASGSVSASPAAWPCGRSSSCATRLFPRWTFRSSRRF